MPFKINIGTKEGKTFKLETDAPGLDGKELGQTIQGEDVSLDLSGYEFEITGASDKSGFTALKEVDGFARSKALLNYGKGMHKRPKGEKKVNKKPNGLRLRKTVRGRILSDEMSQINLKLIKEGTKKLTEIFADQVKSETPAESTSEETPTPVDTPEAPKEQAKEEQAAPEEKKE